MFLDVSPIVLPMSFIFFKLQFLSLDRLLDDTRDWSCGIRELSFKILLVDFSDSPIVSAMSAVVLDCPLCPLIEYRFIP